MKLIFKYMRPYAGMIGLAVGLKFLSTIFELFLPYILEFIIDEIVPLGNMRKVILWGLLMFLTAVLTWLFGVLANSTAIRNAHHVSFDVRQDLFVKTANLDGRQFDDFGLPSLISRMTSDSYNFQAAAQQLQSLCVRAPMMLVGGIFMTMIMDFKLSLILIALLPILIAIIVVVYSKGIPMFNTVQQRLDRVVRIMRENITGIRIVKALSKTEYEKKRYRSANNDMTDSDISASTVMAVPGPLMQLILNLGLVAIVIVGAGRVNSGSMQPGVILAFLTYFNMITMGIMGLSRIFISMSKASASANRIGSVLSADTSERILPEDKVDKPHGNEFIRFENVTFSYVYDKEDEKSSQRFAGGQRENALEDISFAVRKGESLGIIGPTGCGKTTVINLLMHFYDADKGAVFVGGKDVRCYGKDELHRKFGTVFQNDMVFQDSLRENISFGRAISENDLSRAVSDAQAAEYIGALDEGLDYQANIKGANLSGGQRQRLLIARALAASPEILVLDDSSSALDYRTDAAMRKAIEKNNKDSTLIMIAQRVSSVMGLNHIMVMDNGRCIGYGTHEELLANCPEYKEIYDTQMGAMS